MCLLLRVKGLYSIFNFTRRWRVILNESKDLSVIDGVDTEKFDKIIRRPDDDEVDDNDNGGNRDNINADVNADGYVDLSDVLIVRSGMQNSTSYDTDLNDDDITDEIDLAIVKLAAIDSIAAAAPSSSKRLRKTKSENHYLGSY